MWVVVGGGAAAGRDGQRKVGYEPDGRQQDCDGPLHGLHRRERLQRPRQRLRMLSGMEDGHTGPRFNY